MSTSNEQARYLRRNTRTVDNYHHEVPGLLDHRGRAIGFNVTIRQHDVIPLTADAERSFGYYLESRPIEIWVQTTRDGQKYGAIPKFQYANEIQEARQIVEDTLHRRTRAARKKFEGDR